jgi:hypothetical protein
MSTRFYFPITGTPDILPAFDATWNHTSSAQRRPLATTKGTSGISAINISETSTSLTWDLLHGQFISAPLSAQTISGNISCVARAFEDNFTAKMISQLVVRVVSNNGSVVRGTLISPTAATAPGTSAVEFDDEVVRNQLFPAASNTGTTATVSSVTCQDGDRIVVEIGARAANDENEAGGASIELGESTSADLALNQTGTATGSPWIEFYQTIEFVNGPTKLYFPSTGTPAITPAFHAEWETTASAVRLPLSYPKGTSAVASVSAAETSTANLYDVGLAQFISAPLAAQTFSGTLSCVVRCNQSSLAANMTGQMVVRIVSNDGSTVRGTLISPTAVTSLSTSTHEWGTSLRNQYFPSGDVATATLTGVTCEDGDRLVIELGYRAINTVATSYTGTMQFGEAAAGDLVLNQSGTAQANPWLAFSQKVQFQLAVPAVTGTSSATLRALGTEAAGQFAEVETFEGESASTLAALGTVAAAYFGEVETFEAASSVTLGMLGTEAAGLFAEVEMFEGTSSATLPMLYTESAIGGPGPARTIQAAFYLPDYYFTGSAYRIPPRTIESRVRAPKYYFSSTARASDDTIHVSSRVVAPKYYLSATGTAS